MSRNNVFHALSYQILRLYSLIVLGSRVNFILTRNDIDYSIAPFMPMCPFLLLHVYTHILYLMPVSHLQTSAHGMVSKGNSHCQHGSGVRYDVVIDNYLLTNVMREVLRYNREKN